MGAAQRGEELIAALARSRWASVAALLVVTALCVFPGFVTLPLLDGQEPGFMLGAREMIVAGDFATIRLQTGGADLLWAARGGYWLPALLVQFTGAEAAIWVYRVPSLLAALATPILLWWTALAFMHGRAALLAGMFLASSGVFGLQARLAMPDAVLLALLTLAAGLLARMWLRPFTAGGKMISAVFWLVIGVAFLMRGPLAPGALVVTAGLLALSSRALTMQLRSAGGILLLAANVLIWVFVSLAAWRMGAFDYLSDVELRRRGLETILAAPPGLYALLLPLLIGPAVTFLFVGLPWLANNLGRPAVAFSLAWAIPAWMLAEFWPEKSPHMILPALPPLALLAGLVIDRGAARIRGWTSWFYSLGPLIWPPVTAVGVPISIWYLEGTMPVTATLLLLAGAVLGPIAWFWLRGGHAAASAGIAVASAIMIYWGFFGATLPVLSGLRVAERLLAAGSNTVNCQPAEFAVTGYPEESAEFVAGRPVRLVNAVAAADYLDFDGCRVAVVERGRISAFRQRADDLGLVVLDRARIVGINLRKVSRVEMHVFTTESRSRP